MPIIKIPFLLRFHDACEYCYYNIDRMRRLNGHRWTKHFWNFVGGADLISHHQTFSVDMTEVVAVRV